MNTNYDESDLTSEVKTDDFIDQLTFDEALYKVGASHRY